MSSTHPERERLTAFARGGLRLAERGQIEAHLDACDACLGLVAELARDATGLHSSETPTGEQPQLAGTWHLGELIGRGGMGSVYRARDLTLDRLVAIKILDPQHGEQVERFEREARLLAKLEHPNVVPIYEVGRQDGRPFIVMKYLEGQNLESYLKSHPRPEPQEVLSIVQQICAGLEFIHSKGIVHRDIKPANVFLSPHGHVTLLDMGLARDTNDALTRVGMRIGTPAYMSPEQVAGTRDIDRRSDLYSLAALLFELVSGQRPFPAASAAQVMSSHRDQPAPDLTTVAPDSPKGLAQVVARGLAKKREDRFQSASELLEAVGDAYGRGQRVARSRAPWLWFAVGAVVAGLVVVPLHWPRAERPPAEPTPVPLPLVTQPAPVPVVTPPAVAAAAVPSSSAAPSPTPVRSPKVGTLRIATSGRTGLTWGWLDVDGQRKGATPISLTLPAGAHQLVISRPEYQTVTQSVQVRGGQVTVVPISMEPKPVAQSQ